MQVLFIFAVLVLCTCQLVTAQSPCPNETWTYFATSGSCYYVFTDSAISYSNAQSNCQVYQADLVSIDSPEEQDIIDSLLQYNYNKVWIGLEYVAADDQYYWLDGWPLNLTSRWGPSSPDKTYRNAYMGKNLNQANQAYMLASYWYSVGPNSTSVDSYICEFVGPRCSDVADVENATASSWKNYLNNSITWSCNEGYRLSNATVARRAVNGSVSIDMYYKQYGTCMSNGSSYSWNSGPLQACEPKYCFDRPLNSNNSGGPTPTCDICSSNYSPPFSPGAVAVYTCPIGYRMPFGNTTTMKAICGNNPNVPASNMWKPHAYPCAIVTCPPLYTIRADNSLTPTGTDLNGKVVRAGGSVYLIQYGSTVNITCIPGYIYADGLITRLFQCNARNSSGYWSIVTPNAAFYSPGCSTIMCPNLTLTVISYMKNGLNVTWGDYRQTNYQSQFSVSCPNGFTFPDGQASKTLTCDALQRWNDGTTGYSTLPACIAVGQSFLGNLIGQKYDPPKQEAPNATVKGGTIVCLLGIFLSIIILMDVAALPRDVSILRRNCRRLRERTSHDKASYDWQSQLTEAEEHQSVTEAAEPEVLKL